MVNRSVLVTLLAALGVLTGLARVAVADPPGGLQVSTEPPLFPDFDQSVSDYVVRCQPSNEVQVSVAAPASTKVFVDHVAVRKGSGGQTVSLGSGQSFEITIQSRGNSTSYFVRCLPSDFPPFDVVRNGPAQAEWYVVTPGLFGAPTGVSRQYAAFFDNNGVPVWWMPSSGSTIPLDAKLLPNGDVAWLHLNPGPSPLGMEERSLDGSLVRTLDTNPGGADHHDVQLLPNGDYLMGRSFTRSIVDMSACGGSSSGNLTDFELQELSPTGTVVWAWRASDHIAFSEVTTRWQSNCSSGGDIYHWNSVEPDGDGYVLSFRHLDAVYRIDRATGTIDWKVGGVHRDESLTVIGDDQLSAVSTFCGQHDARALSDGSLTVFDDGSGCDRPARAVRFAIDGTARTATLLEDVRDPDGARSFCCGSTRRLPGGNWVTQWGSTPYLTEQTGNGVPVFKLTFTDARLVSYRANPVPPGQVSRAALREGMDAQYPRP